MIKGYWCFKVLPLVYDGSLSYYEVLCKLVEYLNHVIEDAKKIGGDIQSIEEDMRVIKLEIERLDNRCGGLEERVRLVENRCENLEGGIRSVGQRIVNLYEIAETLSGDIVDLSNDIDAVNQKVPFAFGVDENGNYGYYKDGADTVTPFKTGGDLVHFYQFTPVETVIQHSIFTG